MSRIFVGYDPILIFGSMSGQMNSCEFHETPELLNRANITRPVRPMRVNPCGACHLHTLVGV